jgi:Glycosyltransferase family 87
MSVPMPSASTELLDQHRAALRAFTILGGFFCVLAAAVYATSIAWVDPIPRDGSTLVIGRDFLNFWMYGRAAVTPNPSRFYDLETYQSMLEALLGPGYPGQNWSYPPSVMLLAAPFGQLGYFSALGLWTLLGVAVFVWLVQRQAERQVLIILMVSPAMVLALMAGQSSLLTAAMLIAIFAWLDRRPIGAGILIGVLTLKPQLGLLLPVLLIASGRWRVLAAATITSLAIAGLTAFLFGPQVWIDYVRTGIPVHNLVLADPKLTGAPFNVTIFMNARVAGAGYELAMALQSCFSVLAIAAVFWSFRYRRNFDPQLLMGLFLACSLCVTPYLMSYDTIAMVFAAMMLVAAGKLDALGRRLAQLVYWLPVLQVAFGRHLPGPALVAPALAIYLLMRLRGSVPVSTPGLTPRSAI